MFGSIGSFRLRPTLGTRRRRITLSRSALDEKSQIQALDLTAPELAVDRSHGFSRYGITTLFLRCRQPPEISPRTRVIRGTATRSS